MARVPGEACTLDAQWRLAMLALDCAYPALVAAQRRAIGRFPAARFTRTWPAAANMACHIVAGGVAVACGAAWFFYSRSHWMPVVMAWATLVHTLTCCNLISNVSGEQHITIPLYTGAMALNAHNALDVLLNGGDDRSVHLLWSSMNIFVVVRVVYFTLAHLPVGRSTLYTYSISTAGLAVLLVSGHSPNWLAIYALPALCTGIIPYRKHSLARSTSQLWPD
eukprot:jgi/Chlat1/7669/Chrsp64S07126